jgi:hypothetical protein
MKYKVTRIWYVEAKHIYDAIKKAEAGKHDKIEIKKIKEFDNGRIE